MSHIHERSIVSSIEQPSGNDSDVVNSQVVESAGEKKRGYQQLNRVIC